MWFFSWISRNSKKYFVLGCSGSCCRRLGLEPCCSQLVTVTKHCFLNFYFNSKRFKSFEPSINVIQGLNEIDFFENIIININLNCSLKLLIKFSNRGNARVEQPEMNVTHYKNGWRKIWKIFRVLTLALGADALAKSIL